MTRVRAQILTIGDELLAGDVVDENKAFLGRRCRSLGIEVVRALSIRDREQEIVAAMREAGALGQVCLVSGGLGPTTDDLTASAAALAAGVELVRHAELARRLEAFFVSRGRALVEANLKQADLPAGALVLDNPIGTAAGFALELRVPDAPRGRDMSPQLANPRERSDQARSVASAQGGEFAGVKSCWLFSMPGVPREMHKMMLEQVEPRLRERFELRETPRRVHRSLGLGESQLQQRVMPALEVARARSPGLANMFVHYRARYPEVQLILEAIPGEATPGEATPGEATPGETDAQTATPEELASLDAPLREAIGRSHYAVGEGEGPGELVELLVAELIARGLKLATAESCTGGGIGQAITSVSGSSACFVGGVIAYANEVKISALGVPAEQLAAHGAVSEPVARAMAEGARTRLGADIGVSTTGIAGPGGGTPDKPVGTVDVAVATASGTTYKRLRLFGERDTIRNAGVAWALKFVWDALGERPPA